MNRDVWQHAPQAVSENVQSSFVGKAVSETNNRNVFSVPREFTRVQLNVKERHLKSRELRAALRLTHIFLWH